MYVEEVATSADSNTPSSNENVNNTDSSEDFELLDISDEEIPDFLKGEEIEKY